MPDCKIWYDDCHSNKCKQKFKIMVMDLKCRDNGSLIKTNARPIEDYIEEKNIDTLNKMAQAVCYL
ncbi:MAG: hypothetical protein GY834_10905 [Bacteroidetes bacterium]|nr:hypothetical protein [Bacteroidota bacterium]